MGCAVLEADWLIALTVPPALEEAVVDWLLSLDNSCGYTSYPVSGHSGQTEGMTVPEQVSGRKGQIRFEVHVAAADLPSVLQQLRRDFQGTRMHYWITAIQDHGEI